MAKQRYVVIDPQGQIVNAVVGDDQGTTWSPPENHTIVASDEYEIGGTLIADVYTPPPPQDPEE